MYGDVSILSENEILKVAMTFFIFDGFVSYEADLSRLMRIKMKKIREYNEKKV